MDKLQELANTLDKAMKQLEALSTNKEPLTFNGKEVELINEDTVVIDGCEYGLGFIKNFIDDCDQLGVTKVFSVVTNNCTIEDLKELLTKIESL